MILVVLTWGAGLAIGIKPAVGLLIAAGYAAAVIGLRRPVVGLYGIGILCTLDAPSRYLLMRGGLLRWNTFNYWLVIVILLSLPLLLRLKGLQIRLMQLFVLLLTAGLAISPDWKVGADDLLSVVILFGLLVYFARASRDERVWYWLGLISGLVGAAGGLVFYLRGHFLIAVAANAWKYLPLTAMFSLCLGNHIAVRQKRNQLIFGLLATLNFVWVFLSGSRGGMLIGLCCLLFLFWGIRSFWRRMTYAALAVLIGCVILALFPEIEARTLRRISILWDPSTSVSVRTSGRYDLALGGWYIFLEHPLGVGTGGFRSAWSNLEYQGGLSGFGAGTRRPAQSGWMKSLVENSIPGILLHAGFVASFAFLGWRNRQQRLLGLGLLGMVTLGVAFIVDDFGPTGLSYLAAGIMVLLYRADFATSLNQRETALGD